jgi:hypothetical protein
VFRYLEREQSPAATPSSPGSGSTSEPRG